MFLNQFEAEGNKNAFAHAGGRKTSIASSAYIAMRGTDYKPQVTLKGDLHEVTDDIETKYLELKRQMEEAKMAQAQKKT